MRAYNFPVHTAPDDGSDRVFRLVLDPRFSAAEMLADYPRNVVQPFLDIVIAEGKQPALFKAAGPHAIDVSMPAPHRVSDADRAILTNLMDFGQDFDSARSTTISELVFTMVHPDEHVAGRFLEALARRNAEAVAFMNDIMRIVKEESPEILEQSYDMDCRMTLRIRKSAMPKLRARLEKVETLRFEEA